MNQERILTRSPSVSAELQRADYREQKEKLRRRVEMGSLAAGRKRCFKCKKIKPVHDFYFHPQMADGRLGKCKQCTKDDVADRYVSRRPVVLAYERWRQQTESRREKKQGYHREHNLRNPEKAHARNVLANALRSGKIIKKPCRVCGAAKVEGHHPDYSKPLKVRWLCFKHHREAHGQIVG